MFPHPYLSVVLGILAVWTTLVTGTVERTIEHRGVTKLIPCIKTRFGTVTLLTRLQYSRVSYATQCARAPIYVSITIYPI